MHWTSGIEAGIRLISLAWIRRLLDGWPGVRALFEDNDLAVLQIRWHQEFLNGFRSRGSSANNHVIAEAAGQLVASCAFPWFPESGAWRRKSARLLERELVANTFPSGVGRELASEYQGFVAELTLLAAVEAGAAGHPLVPELWQRLSAVIDSGAALVDEQLRAPRQGDGDDGRAMLLDAPTDNPWPSLLAVGEALFGRLELVAAGRSGRGQHADRRPGRGRAGTCPAGPGSARRGSPTPGSRCCAPTATTTRRSGAGWTAARTGSSASPRTRTPTPCRPRCGTAAWTCWPTRAPTATTATRPGGRTSAPPSRTTRSRWRAATSPVTVARSSGCGTPTAARSRSSTPATWPAGPPTTTVTWP